MLHSLHMVSPYPLLYSSLPLAISSSDGPDGPCRHWLPLFHWQSSSACAPHLWCISAWQGSSSPSTISWSAVPRWLSSVESHSQFHTEALCSLHFWQAVMNRASSLTRDYPAPSHYRPQPRYQPQWIHVHLILTPDEFHLLLVLLYVAMYLVYALAHSW